MKDLRYLDLDWHCWAEPAVAPGVRAGFTDEGTKLVELTDDIYVYRYWGDKTKESGSYWYSARYYGSPRTRRQYAALPEKNPATRVSVFKIKKGTRILYGKVASQKGDVDFCENATGGGTQIYLNNNAAAELVENIE